MTLLREKASDYKDRNEELKREADTLRASLRETKASWEKEKEVVIKACRAASCWSMMSKVYVHVDNSQWQTHTHSACSLYMMSTLEGVVVYT